MLQRYKSGYGHCECRLFFGTLPDAAPQLTALEMNRCFVWIVKGNKKRWLTCIHKIHSVKIDRMRYKVEDAPLDLFRIVRHDLGLDYLELQATQ